MVQYKYLLPLLIAAAFGGTMTLKRPLDSLADLNGNKDQAPSTDSSQDTPTADQLSLLSAPGTMDTNPLDYSGSVDTSSPVNYSMAPGPVYYFAGGVQYYIYHGRYYYYRNHVRFFVNHLPLGGHYNSTRRYLSLNARNSAAPRTSTVTIGRNDYTRQNAQPNRTYVNPIQNRPQTMRQQPIVQPLRQQLAAPQQRSNPNHVNSSNRGQNYPY